MAGRRRNSITRWALCHYRRAIYKGTELLRPLTGDDWNSWRPVEWGRCGGPSSLFSSFAHAGLLLASGASGGALRAATSRRRSCREDRPARAAGRAGPWRRYLWLKLVKVELTSFSSARSGTRRRRRRPAGPPAASGCPRERSCSSSSAEPGVGGRAAGLEDGRDLSLSAALEAVLSNNVSRNRLGTISYRVTLRNESGRVLGRRTPSRSSGTGSRRARSQRRPNATSSGLSASRAADAGAERAVDRPRPRGRRSTPARIRARQTSVPSAAANAYARPVEGRGEDDVVRDRRAAEVGRGQAAHPDTCGRSPRRGRRAGLDLDDGSTLVTCCRPAALPQPQRSTTGTNSRPSS